MFVDSHCHLDRVDLKPYDGLFDRFVQATQADGVEHMLCVCIDMENYGAMRELVGAYDCISTSVGVHPTEIDGLEPDEELLVAHSADQGNVAIGETGLDYFRIKDDLVPQQERFRRHIRAARACRQPLIIHTRNAREDTIAIMREENAAEAGGVMHCFTETWEMARAALDLGFYISFSGIVTFKNAAELRHVAEQVPLDRILIETDSPYLAPVPFRGKSNQPRYVPHVAEQIAQLRGLETAEIAEITKQNFFTLFTRAAAARTEGSTTMQGVVSDSEAG